MKGLLHTRSLSGIVYKPEEIPDSAKIDASLFRENLSKARICRRKSYWIKKAILPGNYAQSAYKWRLACETARPAGFGRDKLLAMYYII